MKWNKPYKLMDWTISGKKNWIKDDKNKILEFDTYREASNYAAAKGMRNTYPVNEEEAKQWTP